MLLSDPEEMPNLFNQNVLSVNLDLISEAIKALKEKQELKAQGKGDWEPSISGKSHNANFEERLAKHIADELLRNNPALARIHSNNSVRKILEQELQRQIEHQQQH